MSNTNCIGYKWHPIEDFSSDEEKYFDSGLKELSKVWLEQKDELDAKGLVGQFLCRLQRQWAIETGILEKIYTLDRGVTQILIEKGLEANYITHASTDKSPEFVAQVIKDQYEVVNGIFDFVKSTRPLSTGYIKELHAALCRNQKTTKGVDDFGIIHDIPLLLGSYKEQPNSPTRTDGLIHEYCPPLQVASEMDKLIELHTAHEQQSPPVAPEIEAAWIHHRFTQIHPFQDGNGRIARALASLVFIKAGWFPLTITRDDRNEYIDALEKADCGDLIPLITLFAKIQRKTFTAALGLAGEIKNAAQVSTVIQDIRSKFEAKRSALYSEREKVKSLAAVLIEKAKEEMSSTADMLREQLKEFVPSFSPYVKSARNEDAQSHYYRNQVVAMTRKNGYFANLPEYRAWCCLVLPGKNQGTILVSAHAVGHEYRGLIAISACFFNKNESGESNLELGDFATLGNDYFLLNYEDEKASAEKRFSAWLNDVLVTGLAMWNDTFEAQS